MGSADLRPWVEKNAEAGISAPTWTVNAFNSVPKSSQCFGLRSEVLKMYSDFESLAKGDGSYMGQVDAAATTVLEGVQTAHDMEEDMRSMEKAMSTAEVAITTMSGIPYVGPLLKVMGQGLKQARTKVIEKARGQLKKFNDKLERYKVEKRACTLSSRNRDLAQKLAGATDNYDEALSTTFKVDRQCLLNVPVSNQVCQPWKNKQARANAEVATAKNALKKVMDAMKVPAEIIKKVMALAKNKAYKAMKEFFDELNKFLQPVYDLLNKRICETVPIPSTCPTRQCVTIRYPCGVKHCSYREWGVTFYYPCGDHWCSRHECATVHLPCFKDTNYCFSVSDIINGAMSLMDVITDALEAAVEALAEKLGIDIPSIANLLPPFPTLDVYVPAIPKLPSLPALPTMPNVPSFPCVGGRRRNLRAGNATRK